jgi:ABC-type branched-subunit amino acid transport system ATPase component
MVRRKESRHESAIIIRQRPDDAFGGLLAVNNVSLELRERRSFR